MEEDWRDPYANYQPYVDSEGYPRQPEIEEDWRDDPRVEICLGCKSLESKRIETHMMHSDNLEKKQAAADVLFNYSKFALVCIGNQVRPCDLRLHLMKEISGIPTSLKRASSSHVVASTEVMGESSSSGNSRLDKADSFKAL